MLFAFTDLCNTLCSECCLNIPTQQDTSLLHMNASGKGIGAVLSVVRDGEEVSVEYYSKQDMQLRARF